MNCKLITENDCAISAVLSCSPAEFLIINKVISRCSTNEDFAESDRKTMALMGKAMMNFEQVEVADTQQTETKVVGYCNECKWFRNKQVCGRCRSRNLFCEAEPQPRCPKCGKRGYIRSLESMGVKLKVFDEYRWKCTNCNKYFKEEPKDEPQTNKEIVLDPSFAELSDEQFVKAMKLIEPQTDCGWK